MVRNNDATIILITRYDIVHRSWMYYYVRKCTRTGLPAREVGLILRDINRPSKNEKKNDTYIYIYIIYVIR